MRKSSLKKLWKEISFRPKKSMGQNYLVDDNIVRKLIDSYQLSSKEKVLEIGSGFGALTSLIAERCDLLWAVEKDRASFNKLKDSLRTVDNLKILNKDILKADICSLIQGEDRLKVIGNIPYSISSPVIAKVLEARSCVSSVYFVLQEELIDRIVATPALREHSRLSVFVQYYAEAEKLFRIKRNSFFPVPKVDSALLYLKIREKPLFPAQNEELLFFLVKAGFAQRRKKAVNSMANSVFRSVKLKKELLKDVFVDSGVDVSTRAEVLDLRQWRDISDKLNERLCPARKKDLKDIDNKGRSS